MKCASIAHNEVCQWTTIGYSDFVNSNFLDDVNDLTGVKSVGIQSSTFNREAQKHFVKSVTKGMELDPKTLNKIIKELETAPDKKFLPEELPPALGGEPQTEQDIQASNQDDNVSPNKNSLGGINDKDLKALIVK